MKHSLRWLGAMLALPMLLSGPTAALAASAPQHGAAGFITDVARHLGVPEQKLKGAITQARLDRVRTLLQKGRITQAQAAKMERAIKEGRFPRPCTHRSRIWGSHMVVDAAAYLGVTPEDFIGRLRQGETPAAIAQAQGKTGQGLEQALRASAERRIAAAVAAGQLTQEQAKRVQSHLAGRVHRFVNSALHGAAPGVRTVEAPARAN